VADEAAVGAVAGASSDDGCETAGCVSAATGADLSSALAGAATTGCAAGVEGFSEGVSCLDDVVTDDTSVAPECC
jgi:hypothetical protein